jgi:hypothetical protein
MHNVSIRCTYPNSAAILCGNLASGVDAPPFYITRLDLRRMTTILRMMFAKDNNHYIILEINWK